MLVRILLVIASCGYFAGASGHTWVNLELKNHEFTEKRITLDEGAHLKFIAFSFDLDVSKGDALSQKLFTFIQKNKDLFELHIAEDRNEIMHTQFRWYQLVQKGTKTQHYFYVQYVPKRGAIVLEDFGSKENAMERYNNQALLAHLFDPLWFVNLEFSRTIKLMGCPDFLLYFIHSPSKRQEYVEAMEKKLKELYMVKDIDGTFLIHCLETGVLRITKQSDDFGNYTLSLENLSFEFSLSPKSSDDRKEGEDQDSESSDYFADDPPETPVVVETSESEKKTFKERGRALLEKLPSAPTLPTLPKLPSFSVPKLPSLSISRNK